MNLINKPEFIFVVLALIFGLIFVFANPPFQVPDENSHFYKAFEISQGHLIPKSNIAQIPTSILTINTFPSNTIMNNFSKISFYLSQPLNLNETSTINIANIAIYPPLPYLATGAIIFLGGLFNSSPLFLMYLCRLINLLIYVIIVYYGIKIIPIHKNILLLLALMPVTLYEASSLSADSLNFAVSFLTVGFFLYLALVKDKIYNKDILISMILVFVLAFSKQAYALLGLLFFIIPKEKFENKIKRIVSFLIVSLPSMISLITWNLLFKSTYASPNSGIVSSDYNIQFILSNPLNFPTILINTLISTPGFIATFVGGFRRLTSNLPLNLIFLYCVILVFVSLLSTSKYKLSFRQKLVPLFIFLVVSLLTFLFEFITYTPRGSNIIQGLQGRYFVPVAPLFLLVFYNNKLFNYISTKIKFRRNECICLLYVFIIIVLTISSYIIYYAI
ncbi:MAG: DUF2142 domain-containing protein [Methanobrevibacter sp.]|jgi:uncharacterized membrane protein|nr:DUF2142 domain-containing protein [Methanobrevibacter sp.]